MALDGDAPLIALWRFLKSAIAIVHRMMSEGTQQMAEKDEDDGDDDDDEYNGISKTPHSRHDTASVAELNDVERLILPRRT
jgi:hypothetical protein